MDTPKVEEAPLSQSEQLVKVWVGSLCWAAPEPDRLVIARTLAELQELECQDSQLHTMTLEQWRNR